MIRQLAYRIYRWLTVEQLSVVSHRWKADAPISVLEELLDEEYENKSADNDEKQWYRADSLFGRVQVIQIVDNGYIQLDHQLRQSARLALTAILLVSALLQYLIAVQISSIESIESGFLGTIIPLFFFASHILVGNYYIYGNDEKPLSACSEQIEERWTKFYPLFVLGGIICISRIFLASAGDRLVPSLIFLGVMAAIGIYIIRGAEGDADTDSTTLALSNIPLRIAMVSFLATIIAIALPGLILFTERTTLIYLMFFSMTAVFFVFFLSSSHSTEQSLKRQQLQPYQSSGEKVLPLILFLILTFIYISPMILIGIPVLLYGVTGTLYFPTDILNPWEIFVNATVDVNANQPGSFYLESMYIGLRQIVEVVPFAPLQFMSVLLMLVLLWPVGFIVIGSVVELLAQPIRLSLVLMQSQPLSENEGQNLLPDNIQVRRYNCGGRPQAKPVRAFFGLRQYVIVSDIVADELNSAPKKELEAVLRHEEYHLQEDQFGLILKFITPLFGGKNAAFAFYDYRESERSADDYAARETSPAVMRRALDQLGELLADFTESKKTQRIPGQYPGIVRRDTGDSASESDSEESSESDDSAEGGRESWLQSRLIAVYNVYFGWLC
jgi:hypothetical protein